MRGTLRHAPMIAPRTARVTSTDAFVSPLRASAHSRHSLGIRLPRASPRPAIDPSGPWTARGWAGNEIPSVRLLPWRFEVREFDGEQEQARSVALLTRNFSGLGASARMHEPHLSIP